ncbi:hypothetical protein [Methylopila sp. 73B]|uniref:hypothetical protein n=1 Tax=Methylopila sp. 73B TaxID=1120792 RepID=UPI00037ECAAF|nr:hypothetical protein [Methylopila sp. 73B]
MSVVVITPPEALLTPEEAQMMAPVMADDGYVRVRELLAAAQAAIEPVSWPGAAFGRQTLEWRLSGFPCASERLPFGPASSIVSVKYDDADGDERTVDAADYRLIDGGSLRARIELRRNCSWPATDCGANAVRIRYVTGSERTDPRLSAAKQAIVLSATALRSLSSADLALRSVEVVGVSTRTYVVSDAASKIVQSAVDRLLAPYWVPSV